jgi:HNH endonuclease
MMQLDLLSHKPRYPELINGRRFELFSQDRPQLPTALAQGFELSAEKILTLLRYDKINGIFYWLIPPRRGISVGTAAGSDSNGYLEICLYGVRCRAHWLVWFLENGEWPLDFVLDHANNKRSDNRITNLRKCTQSQNARNRDFGPLPKSGFRGVSKHKLGLWRSRPGTETKYFSSLEDAAFHYVERCKIIYGEFFDGGKNAA